VTIPSSISNLATGRAVLFALLVWLAAGMALFLFGPYQTVLELAQGLTALDERLGYSWQDAMILFATLGEAGRRAYRTFLIADVGNALLFASAFTLASVFLAGRLGVLHRRIALLASLPGLVGLVDLVENGALFLALFTFPNVSESTIAIASAATSAKLVLGAVTALAVALGLVAWGVRRTPSRRTEG